MQAYIFISGFVQGVGFRHFIRQKAREYGVLGWVRNTSDGRVEAVLAGTKEDIENVINECKKGPMLSKVKDVVVSWEEEKEKFSDFAIRHE